MLDQDSNFNCTNLYASSFPCTPVTPVLFFLRISVLNHIVFLQPFLFFSPDSMEQAKPHYQSCWPSIVHAASLWLNNGGFESTKRDMEQGKSTKHVPVLMNTAQL